MNRRQAWLFEAPIGDAMDERWQPGGGARRKDAIGGGVQRGGTEQVRRRPFLPDEVPPTDLRIPQGGSLDCGTANASYPTREQAYRAALAAARRLSAERGQTFTVGNVEGPGQPGERPHFHIRAPNGQRCHGHFFYGRTYYIPKKNRPAARDIREKHTQAIRLPDIERERNALLARQQGGEPLTRQQRFGWHRADVGRIGIVVFL